MGTIPKIERIIQNRLENAYRRNRADGNVSEALEEALFSREEETGQYLFDWAENLKNRVSNPPGSPVVSRVGGFVPHSDTLSPPHTNRGATNSIAGAIEQSARIVKGGYDGGCEVGFDGVWDVLSFGELIETLEAARLRAEIGSKGGKKCHEYVELCGKHFEIQPYGTNGGVCYRYILKGCGLRLYFHSSPDTKNIQPVRVHYEAESLIGRSLFSVHAAVCKLLSDLGFRISDEKISRLDLQVMIDIPVENFVVPVVLGHAVKRAQKDTLHRKHGKVQTYRLGVNTILRIYDKRAELLEGGDDTKLALMIKECFGGELPEVCTRVEYQLRRDLLRETGINSVTDLQSMETDLVRWLTSDWFRLLDGPKKKNNESRQAVLADWQRAERREATANLMPFFVFVSFIVLRLPRMLLLPLGISQKGEIYCHGTPIFNKKRFVAF